MHIYDIIKKKRDGLELTYEELSFAINGFTAHTIPDYQISALLMAMFIKGMTPRETADMTDIMANSGDMLDLSEFGERSVDKHSTGGVGDKTTIIVAPIVASLGGIVAKMSGRGLGHTGGTVDKLESFDGYETAISPERFLAQVRNIGLAVVGQSGNMAPADKLIYALRDVTATIDSIPLIASSIMSKKLAAGAKSIVLDVKYGSGAFMKTYDDAVDLAKTMIDIGTQCGRKVCAVISDMDEPLGFAVGNSLEIIEAVEVLRGNGPQDLKEVSITLASEMLSLSNNISTFEAKKQVENAISDGRAYNMFKRWITEQGGDHAYFTGDKQLNIAPYRFEVRSNSSGYVSAINAESIGHACTLLGAGRETKEDSIDLSAGIILKHKIGDLVNAGDILLTLYTSDESKICEAADIARSAYRFSNDQPPKRNVVGMILR